MKQKMMIIANLILFLITSAAISPRTAEAHFEQNQYSQIGVLFILDNSGSMANHDPYNLRYAAARLFTALLNEGDAVGALVFANQAHAITQGVERINSQEDKNNLADQFQPLTADGYTDVKAAFTLASQMMETSAARPDNTVIIFLTDGEPEPLSPTPDYETETIDLAKSLGMPVLSIALTPNADTPFLTRLAAETEGQVHPANSALDLLDVFLGILGSLKHRIILGEGQNQAPTTETFNMDPGLLPYVSQASFVISKDNGVAAALSDPTGQVIAPDDARLTFLKENGPGFSILTIENLSAGEWTVHLDGAGRAQVRVILHASLRGEILSPGNFNEAGAPLLITAAVVEEQNEGSLKRVIGEAQFNATISLPDGTQESLDRFYDDGTHGDMRAGDGVHSRLYLNTAQPGTYQVLLQGYKGLVPLQDQSQVTLIAFPVMSLAAPEEKHLHLDDSGEIAIDVTFSGEGLDAGHVIATIEDPQNSVQTIPLAHAEGHYTGTFTPLTSGTYTLMIAVEEGEYHHLPYTHTLTRDLSITIVPKITINQDLTSLDMGRTERLALVQGVPLHITTHSSVDHAVTLNAALEGAAGLKIAEPASLTVPANQRAELVLTLKAVEDIPPDAYEGQLALTTDEGITLNNAVLPFSVVIFDPTLTIQSSAPLTCGTPEGCWRWESIMRFQVHSSSLQEERISLAISGAENITLTEEEIVLAPGEQEINLRLEGSGVSKGGDLSFSIILTPQREGVILKDQQNEIPVVLPMPSMISRCKNLLIWGGLGLALLVILINIAVRNIRKVAGKPLVTGTLQYWPENAPQQSVSIDLTECQKQSLSLGSDPSCDIVLSGAGLAPKHLVLSVQKDGRQTEIVLTPIGRVVQGYSRLLSDQTLTNEMTFQIGNTHFRYLSDSGY